jgi:hypothetical protein
MYAWCRPQALKSADKNLCATAEVIQYVLVSVLSTLEKMRYVYKHHSGCSHCAAEDASAVPHEPDLALNSTSLSSTFNIGRKR